MRIALLGPDSLYGDVERWDHGIVSEQERGLRWSEETRLRAIDATAFWEGRVNRSDLMRRFGISVPQATNDLREYQARAPANLRYDTRAKAYLTVEGFQPLFGPPSAEAWLAAGETGATVTMPVATTPVPARRLDPWLLRRMLAGQRAGFALRILYQPMDKPEPDWRWVSPVAFGGDGLRWHLRAYNHDAARYEDLLFPRMIGIEGERPAGLRPPDADWNRLITVRLRAAARLSPGQRRVVEADYGMRDSEVRIEVRAALLFLFLRRMRLDQEDGWIELVNRAEVNAELELMAGRFARIEGKSARDV
jgi:hypothetical protein